MVTGHITIDRDDVMWSWKVKIGLKLNIFKTAGDTRVYGRGSANLATAWLLVHYAKAGVFLAVAVWGGQRGGHICIEVEGVIW